MLKMNKKSMSILLIAGIFSFVSIAGLVYAQRKEPIKIGVIDTNSGFTADQGYLQRCGYLMALEDYGETILGRPVTCVWADGESNPDVAGGL